MLVMDRGSPELGMVLTFARCQDGTCNTGNTVRAGQTYANILDRLNRNTTNSERAGWPELKTGQLCRRLKYVAQYTVSN